jgi:hypothetical protein
MMPSDCLEQVREHPQQIAMRCSKDQSDVLVARKYKSRRLTEGTRDETLCGSKEISYRPHDPG